MMCGASSVFTCISTKRVSKEERTDGMSMQNVRGTYSVLSDVITAHMAGTSNVRHFLETINTSKCSK
jgi:hypothetical protein